MNVAVGTSSARMRFPSPFAKRRFRWDSHSILYAAPGTEQGFFNSFRVPHPNSLAVPYAAKLLGPSRGASQNLFRSLNVECRTRNIEFRREDHRLPTSIFDVPCSIFDIRFTLTSNFDYGLLVSASYAMRGGFATRSSSTPSLNLRDSPYTSVRTPGRCAKLNHGGKGDTEKKDTENQTIFGPFASSPCFLQKQAEDSLTIFFGRRE
jgi:hypothetical protein